MPCRGCMLLELLMMDVKSDMGRCHAFCCCRHARRVGVAEEFFNSLVALELAIECDAFIGTLSSNWSLMIDALRATVACNALPMYYDVSKAEDESQFAWKELEDNQ
jgi:hypothetical protein